MVLFQLVRNKNLSLKKLINKNYLQIGLIVTFFIHMTNSYEKLFPFKDSIKNP